LKLFTILCLCAGLAAGPSSAQEFVTAPGRLSDEDFYRLVACAAPPGGECQKPFVRWSKRDAARLTVGITGIDDGYPAQLQGRIDAALDVTVAELNATGANLRLTRATTGKRPDISIFLLDQPRNSTITGTGLSWFDGLNMEMARMQMGWRGNGTVIDCAVAISRDMRPRDAQRIVTEEVTQCLGLLTDIGGSYYESRSVFSETSGQTSRLGPQDIMALRRHYP
jgi:hypothetical protein